MTDPSDAPDDPSLPSDRLDPDTAGEIIRRATELDLARARDESGVPRHALEAAADEVGISPASVRRAMAEHDAGTLRREESRHSLLGPARARAVRTVDLPVAIAQKHVSTWLKVQLLEVHRRTGDELEWRRREDLGAKLRRKVNLAKRIRLGNVDAVIASVVDDGNGRSIVRLEADLEHTRAGLKIGVVGVPTAIGPALGGAAAIVLGDPLLLAAGIPFGMVLGAAGIVVARRTLGTELAEAQRVIDLYLDELDRGK
ncbi:hypothetical protein [Actinospongicola halichondriae]|uniref:hypothetical protein n=1 Tax=Actinospongicola halichondriae TaxID=3236844 RepID=UPI003D3FF36F